MPLRAHDREIVWDRNLAPGAVTYDLRQLVPDGYPTAPTSCAIVSGNGAGHWSVAGFNLSNAAVPTAEVYALGVRFSRAGEADLTVTLTITTPQIVRYVHRTAGNDLADGLTRATAWSSIPGELGASGLPSSWRPNAPALCVIAGDSVCRVGQVSNIDKLTYASGHLLGWGTTPAEVTSFAPMEGAVAVSALEVGGNANWASIKRYARPLPDSACPLRYGGWDGRLSMPAQWPARGADRLTGSQNPRLQETAGMRRVALASVSVAERQVINSKGDEVTVYDIVITDPAMDAGANAGLNFTGYEVNLWCGQNHIHAFAITGHNAAAHTLSCTADLLPVFDSAGFTAYSIQGHPAFIRAADDFAWSLDKQTIYGWWGGDPEIATQQFVFRVSTSTAGGGGPNLAFSGGAYGLRISGYFTSELNPNGGGYGGNTFVSTTCTHKVIGCAFRFGGSRRDQAGAVRFQKAGTGLDNWLIEGNDVRETFRTSGIRLSAANTGSRIRWNTLDRISFTAIYSATSTNVLIELNRVSNTFSTHGNCITIYTGAINPTIQFNEVRNSARPLTHHAITGGHIYANLFETDLSMEAATGWNKNSTDVLWERNLFTFPPGAVLDGSDSVMLRGTGTAKNCAFMGFTLDSPGPVMQNCFSGYRSGNEGNFLVAPHSGNSRADLPVWDGVNMRAQEKAAIGPGWFGYARVVADVSSLTFADQNGVGTGSQVVFKSQLSADAPSVNGVVSGAASSQVRVTSDAAGTVVLSDWAASFAGAVAGNWIWVRHTATSVNNSPTVSSLDLGSGNVFTATSRTVAASGWPNQVFDGTQDWRTAQIALPGEDSKYMTGGFAGRFDNIDAVTTGTFAGTRTGNAYWQVEALITGTSPNKQIAFRIKGRDINNLNQCYFSTPTFTLGEEFTLMWSVDLTKPSGAEGIKVRYKGNMVPATVLSGWVQDGLITWSGLNTYVFGNAKLVGVVGCFMIENSWVDITSDDVWSKFTALRLGKANGVSIFGRRPLHLLVGNSATWNGAGGINLGRAGDIAGGKFAKGGGNDVTGAPSSVNAWPSYTYATALTITGPAKVQDGVPAAFTVTPNGALADPIVVALGDSGGGGAWSPLTINFAVTPSGAANYTPAGVGYRTLTGGAGGLAGGALVVESTGAPATAYTVDLAAGGPLGVPAAYTLTLNGANPDGVAIDPGLSGISGLISPDWVLDPGIAQISGQFTPMEVGMATFTPASTLADPPAFTYAARPNAPGGVEGGPALSLSVTLGL